MRYVIGYVMAGIGAFLLAAVVLLHFYVAPRLKQAPPDVYKVVTLRADGATYFDAASLQQRTGATVTVTSTVRGDTTASSGHIATWDSFIMMQDLPRTTTVGYSKIRIAFDRRTGRLVNCCGANIDGDDDAQMSGIDMFWPLNVGKRTYPIFDSATKKAWPAVYEGQEMLHGLRLYRFVQHIPDTVMAGGSTGMPGKLLGLKGKDAAATIQVDRHYQADNVFWVEPRTGVSVDVRQNVRTTMVPRQGQGQLVVAALDLHMSNASVLSLTAKARSAMRSLTLLTVSQPIGLVLGVALVVSGPLLMRRSKTGARHRQEEGLDQLVAPSPVRD
ncbi:DUF3068 domain-containing protein [Actinomadura barringtoniae]|uniref:DUF3068 domain-containing protein n=1 Tax=Actinomadura barringtoniae TaxID=1427535 RepID=A0A939T477_9ACTN|nr:DUF3068 domain-containing protein [Actinomadura barringtoniae]MBO2447819.1 DUF3068 domain-containing protein [Actinomadura barringtoniae]